MNQYYTITQIANEVASRTGKPCTPDRARKACSRNGLGTMLNARCRVIPADQLEAAITAIVSAKRGQPAGWSTVNAKPERPAKKVAKKRKKH